MKYCSKCGNQMADDMLFCQKCGTKSVNVDIDKAEETTAANSRPYEAPISNRSETRVENKNRTMRKGMKVGMIICFVLAGIYSLIGIAETMILGFGFFFVVLGVMFLLLGKSPKGEKYMFGKLRKGAFIALCIALAYVFVIIFMLNFAPTTEISNNTEQNQTIESNDTTVQGETNKKVSLADIEKWYKNEMPAVSQNLIEYSNSVKGISNMNVTESKFRFGENDGWYECHYTYYFTCKVNGEKCIGEARAFRKYNDSNIDWFHFEISRDSDWATIVEEYDESSDATIENYYKELVAQYK